MKPCVSVYSFYPAYRRQEIQFMDIIPKAKEIGFEAMEFIDLPVPEGEDIMAFARKVAERCAASDIKIVQYSPHADFLLGSNKDPWAEAERIKKQIDVAEVLGAFGVRHDHAWRFEDPRRQNYTDALNVIVDPIRSVAEYGAAKGIRTMSENHGRMFQNGKVMEELVRAVNHDNYGILLDIGNNVTVDADPLEGVAIMAPYCMHVHAKDFFTRPGHYPNPGDGWGRTKHGNFFRGTIFGQGILNMPQTFRILQEANYDGYVSLEFEGSEYAFFAVETGYKNIIRCLTSLEGASDPDLFKKLQEIEH
ncbi:MAG: sugar phosphate isomerase/epimerase [Ruminococcaceae bacterium]|nr:sugar phosphate isomerase/epimerase [Oscillospiraceae bacterium]